MKRGSARRRITLTIYLPYSFFNATIQLMIKRMTTQSMETENAVLKAENAVLKEQVEKLRKAILELM